MAGLKDSYSNYSAEIEILHDRIAQLEGYVQALELDFMNAVTSLVVAIGGTMKTDYIRTPPKKEAANAGEKEEAGYYHTTDRYSTTEGSGKGPTH